MFEVSSGARARVGAVILGLPLEVPEPVLDFVSTCPREGRHRSPSGAKGPWHRPSRWRRGRARRHRPASASEWAHRAAAPPRRRPRAAHGRAGRRRAEESCGRYRRCQSRRTAGRSAGHSATPLAVRAASSRAGSNQTRSRRCPDGGFASFGAVPEGAAS